jgi:hypothetical protein
MTQTLEQQNEISIQWMKERCPSDLKSSNGGLDPAYADFMKDHVDNFFAGVVSSESLDSAVKSLRLRLAAIKPEEPEPEKPDDAKQRAVALRWLKDNAPAHLRNDRGTVGPEVAAKIAAYLDVNYGNQWTLSNLDKACKYLMLRGDIPDGRTKKVNSEVQNEKRRDALRAAGQTESQLRNHAKPEPAEETRGISFKDFLGKLIDGSKKMAEANQPRQAVDEKLRVIPLSASNKDLKKYTAAEIRQWMKRKQAANQ